jgi:hypothetical protein
MGKEDPRVRFDQPSPVSAYTGEEPIPHLEEGSHPIRTREALES